jgi:uncharacterized membrane-anchored protein
MATRSLVRNKRAGSRPLVELSGPVRLDRRTKQLVQRLAAGDVAVIDHVDIDRVSAEELIESGVSAVVNVAQSTTGRYPNPGPLVLVRGGVRLIDAPGASLFDDLAEGERVTVRGSALFRNGDCLASGRLLDEAQLERALEEQQTRLAEAIEAFADNTMR